MAVVALALAWLLAFGAKVKYEQSIESFFADDDPAVISYKEAASLFGNDQLVFLSYDDPDVLTSAGMDRIDALATAIGPDRIDGVVDVQTLASAPVFWELDDRLRALRTMPGFLRNRALGALKSALKSGRLNDSMPTIGKAIRREDGASLEALRRRITEHPLLQGTLVDANGKSTALVARLKAPEKHDVKATVAALRAKADAFAKANGLARPAVVGPPVLLADGFESIERDGLRLALVGMALIGLVTLSATQSLWWALVPILAGWVVWLAAETVLAHMNFKLSLSGGPLVAQIIVLTMPAASHLALHFRDERRRKPDRRAAAEHTLDAVLAPVLWCALTGAIGYGALLTSSVMPIRQFGVILGLCSAAAAVLTLAISPLAMLPPFRLEVPVRFGSTSKVAAAMNRLTARVIRHPGPIVLGTMLVVLPLTAGIGRLHYESNYINAFKPDSRVVRDYHAVEDRLGGIGLVTLVLPMETVDKAALDRCRDLDRRVAALKRPDGSPAVSRAISLATVLDPDDRLDAESVATKLDLVLASPQRDVLRSFWNVEAGKARTLVRVVESQPATDKLATFRVAETEAKSVFGSKAFLTGLSNLLTQTTRGVIATSWNTFLWSAGSILLMLTIAFRGPKLAVLAILPTLLSVALALGLMGWIGIKLDVATALVASVALGLSVDDTFHCLLQFRRHRETASFVTSLAASYAVTGPGVLLSSLAVAVGFLVLRFSEFVPFSNFGAMVGIATLGSSLGNVILLPACLSLGERLRAGKPAGVEAEV
jgi:hypothetical protein